MDTKTQIFIERAEKVHGENMITLGQFMYRFPQNSPSAVKNMEILIR